MRAWAARLAGFGLSPLAGLLAPFLLLPLIASRAEPTQWVAVGIAQSAGVLLSTLVTFGWSLRGVAEVASATEQERRALWTKFLWLSLILFILGSIVVAFLLRLGTDASTYNLALCIALATSLASFTPTWFAIGVGKPSILFYYSVLPRLAGTALAAAGIVGTDSLFAYPVGFAACTMLGPLFFSFKVRPVAVRVSDIAGTFAQNRMSAAASLLDAAYSAGFIFLATWFFPAGGLVALVSMDRLFRFAKQGSGTFTNALQHWVSVPVEDQTARRVASMRAHVILGVAGGAFVGLGGPTITRVLFGSELQASYQESVPFGLAFLATTVSSAIAKHLLVIDGRDRAVLISTAVGCVMMVLTLLAIGKLDARLLASGYALCETVVLACRIVAARRNSRSGPSMDQQRPNLL